MIECFAMAGGIVVLVLCCFAFASLLDSTYPRSDRGIDSLDASPPKGCDQPMWVYDEHGDLVPGPPPPMPS